MNTRKLGVRCSFQSRNWRDGWLFLLLKEWDCILGEWGLRSDGVGGEGGRGGRNRRFVAGRNRCSDSILHWGKGVAGQSSHRHRLSRVKSWGELLFPRWRVSSAGIRSNNIWCSHQRDVSFHFYLQLKISNNHRLFRSNKDRKLKLISLQRWRK